MEPIATSVEAVGSRRALRLGIALQAAGAAAIVFGSYSAIGGHLLVERGWSAEEAGRVDVAVGASFAVLGLWLLAAPRASVALLFALVALAEVVAAWLAYERFSHLVPATQALRVGAPIALALLMVPTPRRRRAAELLLRLAIAAVLAMHGYEAWLRHPAFIDLVLGFDQALGRIGESWFGERLFDPHLNWSESTVREVLVAIAVHDALFAVLVLTTRWRFVAAWIAIWAGAAALARPIAGGLAQWMEAAVRACNMAGPLALALLVARRERH